MIFVREGANSLLDSALDISLVFVGQILVRFMELLLVKYSKGKV